MARRDQVNRRQDRVGSSLHIDNHDNPHNVTKEQLGLGEVINVEGYSKSEVDTFIAQLQALINALEAETADLENNKLDRKFSIHLPKLDSDTIPSVVEGELNQYTEVRTEGGLKITEHKIRNQYGDDYILLSFEEII